MTPRFGATIAAALTVTLISGCSSSDGEPATQPAAAEQVAATSTKPAAAKPGGATGSTAHRIGDKVEYDGFTTRLIEFKPKVRLDITPDGPANHWAAAKVEGCWTGPMKGFDEDTISVSWDPWSLMDSQNGRWATFETGTGPQWLTPKYPQYNEDQALRMGECVSGWMEFPVDDGVKVTHVRYTIEGAPPIIWKV